MLMGQFHHAIDEKGRLVIPTKYRMELGESFVITRGLERCIYVYSMKMWEKLVEQISELPFTKKDARVFARTFFSGATVCEFDKNGRINITSPLVDYAALTKNCVIIGVNDRLEIWDEETFARLLDENAQQIEKIAENLFENISL